jgi:hypothetical protein
MSLSFEQRRDAVHAGIAAGTVGCGFGKYAAKQGKIAYCKLPDPAKPDEMIAYGKQLAAFTMSENTILTGIAPEDPRTFDAGREYAFEQYLATLLALTSANRSMIHQLLQFEMPADAVAQLQQFDREQRMRAGNGPAWLLKDGNRELMDNMFMIEGPAALTALHVQTASMRKLMAFAMAPYYLPVKDGLPHPRHSPHFALILNYTSDVTEVNDTMPEQVEEVRRWTNAAVGYRYKQGFHIPQIPVPRDAAKESWHPQD